MFNCITINFQQIWPGYIKPLIKLESGHKSTQIQRSFIDKEDFICPLHQDQTLRINYHSKRLTTRIQKQIGIQQFKGAAPGSGAYRLEEGDLAYRYSVKILSRGSLQCTF